MHKPHRNFITLALAAISISSAAAADKPDALDVGISAAMSRLSNLSDATAKAGAAWAKYKGGDAQAGAQLVALAKGGNTGAQLYVGYMLDNGDGFRQDSAAAAAYFNAAAAKEPIARYDLGVLTLLGRGVAKDQARAMQLFESAVNDAAIEQAAVRLAQFHLADGHRDDAKKWADKAASMGNVVGFHILGRLAFDQRDYKQARDWFEKAAAGGERNSPGYLSRIYGDGLGTEPTKIMGAGWKIIDDCLSGRANDAQSAVLPGIAGNMTADEVARARDFAKQWLKERGGPQPVQYSKTIYQVRSWR